MKKAIALVLILSMTLSLAACGVKETNSSTGPEVNEAVSSEHTNNASSDSNDDSSDSNTALSASNDEDAEEKWVLVYQEKPREQIKETYFYDERGNVIREDVLGAGEESSTIHYWSNDKNGKNGLSISGKISFSDIQADEKGIKNDSEEYYKYLVLDSSSLKITQTESTYDSIGNLVTKTTYSDGKLARTISYEYKNGALSKKVDRDEEDDAETATIYDENENKLTEDVAYDNGTYRSHTEYVDGVISRTESYYYTSDGVPDGYKFETFDERGNLVRKEIFDENDALVYATEYIREFDDHDNVIRYEETCTSDVIEESNYYILHDYVLKYDEQGHMIYKLETNPDSEYYIVEEEKVGQEIYEWLYEEDGRSYTMTKKRREDDTPVVVRISRYLPLDVCLEQQDKIVEHYKQTDTDSGSELFLWKTMLDGCNFGVVRYQPSSELPTTVWGEAWIVNNGQCYSINQYSTTDFSGSGIYPSGTFELDGEDVLLPPYYSPESRRFSKIG